MPRIEKVSLVLAALIAAAGFSPCANAQETTIEARTTVLLPEGVAPPLRVETSDFKLVPLGPELVKIDYDAYMSSIEHLQKTFTRSTSWPR